MRIPVAIIVTEPGGTFAVTRLESRIRFTADGYRPLLLRDVADLGRPMVLRPAVTAPRRIPACPAGDPGDGLGILRVRRPDGVSLSSKSYDHEFYLTWQRGTASVRLGYGPHMTEGLPLPAVVAELHDVDDRDLRLAVDPPDVLADVRLADFRGVHRSGTRYRYVGMFGEYFEYGGLSAEDAAFFDRMLDAMCYAVPAP